MKYNARYRKLSTVDVDADPDPMTVAGTEALVARYYMLACTPPITLTVNSAIVDGKTKKNAYGLSEKFHQAGANDNYKTPTPTAK